MSKLSLTGPYRLTAAAIAEHVPIGVAGVFMVGELDGGIMVRATHLGRSDTDVAAELRALVGQAPGFLCQIATTAAEAFHLECALFHEVRRLDLPHPVRPRGADLSCAICGALGAVDIDEIRDRATYYRSKADEVRAAAETMNESARIPLMKVAESYERLAAALASTASQHSG